MQNLMMYILGVSIDIIYSGLDLRMSACLLVLHHMHQYILHHFFVLASKFMVHTIYTSPVAVHARWKPGSLHLIGARSIGWLFKSQPTLQHLQ